MSSSSKSTLLWYLAHPEIHTFQDYLYSMEEFLHTELQKHSQNATEIEQKIKSGEIKLPDDPDQAPPELDYDNFRLARMEEFSNILWKSFFVSLYTYLESSLTRKCRGLEKTYPNILISLSDIAGEGIIDQAMKFITKVHRVNFDLGTSPEWS
jgi:hypothetical protein